MKKKWLLTALAGAMVLGMSGVAQAYIKSNGVFYPDELYEETEFGGRMPFSVFGDDILDVATVSVILEMKDENTVGGLCWMLPHENWNWNQHEFEAHGFEEYDTGEDLGNDWYRFDLPITFDWEDMDSGYPGFLQVQNWTQGVDEGVRIVNLMAYDINGYELYRYSDEGLEPFDFVISSNILEKYTGTDEDVVIPEGIAYIDHRAFAGNTNIRSVTLPSTITHVGVEAFKDCTNLATINNIENVYEFYMDAFEGTAWLKTQRAKSPLVIVGDQLIDGKTAKGKVVIPNTVKKLGQHCFCGAMGITEVVCPKSVTQIGFAAFSNSSLTKFTAQGNDVRMDGGAFAGCEKLKTFTKTKGMDLGWGTFSGCTGLETIDLGDYKGCIGKTSLDIPETVKDVYSDGMETDLSYIFNDMNYVPLKEYYPKTTFHFAKSCVDSLVVDPRGITVSWLPIDDATQYAVYIKENGKWKLVGKTKETSYYYYAADQDYVCAPFTVRAMVDGAYIPYDTTGFSYYWDMQSYVAPARNVNITTTTKGIRLSFDPLSKIINAFEISRKLEKESDDKYVALYSDGLIEPGTGFSITNFTDTTAKVGVKYTYRIKVMWDTYLWNAVEYHNVQMAPTFEDVAASATYAKAVDYISMRGIMNGTTATTFAPEKELTRAQFVTILWNLEGHPQAKAMDHFTDVAATKSYAKAVNWATENGIANGRSDGTFGPTESITRQDFIVLLKNYAKYKGIPTTVNDPDAYKACSDYADVSSRAVSAIQWGYENGLVGSGGKLNAKNSITRGQVAIIMQRFMRKYSL